MESIDKIASAIEQEEQETTTEVTPIDKLSEIVSKLSENMAEFANAFAAFLEQEKKEVEHDGQEE